jgi:hypothetical protein
MSCSHLPRLLEALEHLRVLAERAPHRLAEGVNHVELARAALHGCERCWIAYWLMRRAAVGVHPISASPWHAIS